MVDAVAGSGAVRVCFLAGRGLAGLLGSSGGKHGGSELQMYLTAREVSKDRAFSVAFLIYDGRASDHAGVSWADVYRMHTAVRRGVPLLSRLVNRRRVRSSLSQVTADVFFQSAAGGITGQIQQWCERHGKAFVYRLASDADVDGSNLASGTDRALYLRGLQGADLIIARNEYQRAELKRRYGKESVILPNVFPMPDSPPSVLKDSVLWVASSQVLKQPWRFLGLARAFPGERFVMVMPPNDVALFDLIRAEARRIPNLTFIERVPYTEIQAHFDRAKVFINTSTVEGFPNTFVQAAMGATPVLSLSVNPDEVLHVNGFGRCAQGDLDRMHADLAELLENDTLRGEMGAAAFSYATATHDIEVVTEHFKEIVRALVETT
jgi:glycosyltransferase involved in cell wall biosynthesis